MGLKKLVLEVSIQNFQITKVQQHDWSASNLIPSIRMRKMIGAFGADHSPGLQQSVLASYELSAAPHKRLMAALKTSHKSVGLYWREPPDLPPCWKHLTNMRLLNQIHNITHNVTTLDFKKSDHTLAINIVTTMNDSNSPGGAEYVNEGPGRRQFLQDTHHNLPTRQPWRQTGWGSLQPIFFIKKTLYFHIFSKFNYH